MTIPLWKRIWEREKVIKEMDSLAEIKEFNAGMLKVCIYDSRAAMGKAAAAGAAARIRSIIAKKGEATLVFAAAPSQSEFLDELCKQDVDWTKVIAFHMDEYIGLDQSAPQGFGNFLRRAIFDKVIFKSVHYLSNQDIDPIVAVQNYEMLLTQNPPDLVFLGVGENGHLAFNDPGVADFTDPKKVKIVDLDPICRNQQVNDGCFEKFDDVPQSAITLTMSMLMSIPQALAIVKGSTKTDAVYRTVNDPISTDCPATILRLHPKSVLYTEREGGAKLL
jgi:glucosamine-6-phosphate deaminase